jgi:hypothetical protein
MDNKQEIGDSESRVPLLYTLDVEGSKAAAQLRTRCSLVTALWTVRFLQMVLIYIGTVILAGRYRYRYSP